MYMGFRYYWVGGELREEVAGGGRAVRDEGEDLGEELLL